MTDLEFQNMRREMTILTLAYENYEIAHLKAINSGNQFGQKLTKIAFSDAYRKNDAVKSCYAPTEREIAAFLAILARSEGKQE